MYTIVVAEDEPWIREGIVEMIDKIGLDCRVIGEAANGDEAWHLVNELWPMLLICDIKMPIRDGLWLIQRIHECMLPVVPIIASGYDEFPYAQTAIRYQVSDFLLKPFSEEQLKDALLNAMRRLDDFKPLRAHALRIQEYVESMEKLEIQELMERLSSLVHLIYHDKQFNRKLQMNLLQILHSKMVASLSDEFKLSVQPLNQGMGFAEVRKYFVSIAEEWLQEHTQKGSKATPGMIRKACDIIGKEYMHNLSVVQMAEQVNLSESHFRYLFKQQTGDNFVAYLNRVRIDKAKELLLSADLKVYEVGEMVGYWSQSHFNRIFKEAVGMTPNEYRKQIGL